MADEETIDHLFPDCPFSSRIWEQLAHCLRFHILSYLKIWTFFGHFRDTYISIDATRYCWIFRRWLPMAAATIWVFGRNKIIESLMTRPDHLTRLSVPVLHSFFTGSISFRVELARGQENSGADTTWWHLWQPLEEMQGRGHDDNIDSNYMWQGGYRALNFYYQA